MTKKKPDTVDTGEEGNTKASSRCRRYLFTLNNWSECELDTLTHEFKDYIIGKEIGDEGTPHLQGYVEFKNARYLSSLKKINQRIHWQVSRGTRQDNINYCSKEKDFISTFREKPTVIITTLRPWQLEIERLVLSDPDDRSIHWYWEPIGNIGKTALIKYLLMTYKWIEFTRATKSADILTIADPKKTCYLFDFARCQEGFCPWIALEQLKDGLVSDSKLKKTSRNVIMNCPHVIVFANWAPEQDRLSMDRWIIKEL